MLVTISRKGFQVGEVGYRVGQLIIVFYYVKTHQTKWRSK